jgi:hypothetical protein
MTKKEFENKSLGQIKYMKDGTIWNAVQIDVDSVRLWHGVNDSFLRSLQHFKDAIYEDRFRVVDQ